MIDKESERKEETRILYMEDDAISARLFQIRLEQEGYVVDLASDGEEGLQLCGSADYDLVAIDYHMPKADGITVLRRLNERENPPPVIMVTSSGDVYTVVEAMHLGASDYLVKDPDGLYLLMLPQVIERVLEKRRLQFERERTIAALHDRNRKLALLNKVALRFTSLLDVDEITEYLVQAICEFTDTAGSSVWLFGQGEPSLLRCAAIYPFGQDELIPKLELRAGEGIAGWVAEHGKSVIVEDARKDPRFSPVSDELLHYRTEPLLAIPMRAQDKIIGVLEMVNKRSGAFTADDEMLAETLASYASIAIENARLFNDLSEQSAELQVRNEELDAFAHTVAHDLKTPLSLVLGFSDMMRDSHDVMDDEEIDLYLERVIENSLRMNHIIESILLLSGARGIQEIKVEPVDMGIVVQEALSRLEFALKEQETTITLPKVWPGVLGFGPWLEEVWYNYIANALKYGGKPPTLWLGYDRLPNNQIRLWVEDNGPGLEVADEDLFKPMIPSAKSGGSRGHGLGLSIVKRIVERLNGTVGVESDAGGGCRFYFTLPAAPSEESHTA